MAPPRTDRPRMSARRCSVASARAASDGFKLLLPHRQPMLGVPAVGLAHAVFEADARPPSERHQARGIDQFARHAIGLAGIECQRAAETGDTTDQCRKISDRYLAAGADV